MLAKLRDRLTYANVVATLALFLALGGVSYGAIRIGSRSIVNNSVRTQDLRNNDIRSKDIRNRTIVGRDVLTSTITGLQVREGSLGKVPDADKLDGQESATFRVHCPTGTIPHAGACFEPAQRAAALTTRAAALACGQENRRLPLWTELESLRQQTGVTLTDTELTANVYGSAPDRVLGINAAGDQLELLSGDPHAFRCVAPLTNQ